MRSHYLALTLLLAVGCATTQSPQEEVVITTQPAAAVTTTVTTPTELLSVHPAFVTAWQGTDPAALAVYFTDEAMVVTPTRRFTGWHEIHHNWLPGLTNYTVTPTTFVREGNNIIVESGNYGFRVTRDGATADVSGLYTHRWQRQPDGSWRLMRVDIK